MGPFRQWPTGSGFEYFYGFVGGETNQWYPALYEGTTPIEPPKTPEEGYHFTEDMTDKAIAWVRQQKSLMPDKPFFMYFAPGRDARPASRAEGVGRQVQGASSTRAGTRARGDARAAEGARRGPRRRRAHRAPRRHPGVGRHAGGLKPVLARQMEVYAGFMEHTDHHIGRLVDALEDLEVLDDTLVYYIIGDNGAWAEGHAQRHLQRDVHLQRRGRVRDRRVDGLAHRRVRRSERVQPLRGRLGARDGHAVPVDQAGRLALGRHAQRHDRPLAERLQGEGRDPLAVPSRDRHRARRSSTSPGCPSRRS